MQDKNTPIDLFSSRLKKALRDKSMTQNALSEKIKIHKQTISRYVTGQRMPSSEELISISNELNVSIDWLLGTSDDDESVMAQDKISDNAIFISRLGEMMKRNSLTQNQLGVVTKISQSTISSYLLGRTAPKSDELFRLATQLSVSMDWLWGRIESENVLERQNIPENEWEKRAKNAEERLERMESILKELFAFAKKHRNINT